MSRPEEHAEVGQVATLFSLTLRPCQIGYLYQLAPYLTLNHF